MPPWLTPKEIADLCKPLKQAAAQIRFMRSLGLTVRTKPNGTPLVMRSHLEEVMTHRAKPQPVGKAGPNRAALVAHFQQGKKPKRPAGQ
jgi:hypothetical protein